MKILLVHKSSTLDHYFYEKPSASFKKLIGSSHASIKGIKKAHDEHKRGLDEVKNILKKSGINFTVIHRDKLNKPVNADFVITVGGDGTFLKASHFVKNQPILGINSSPSMSVGALCAVACRGGPLCPPSSPSSLGSWLINLGRTHGSAPTNTQPWVRLEIRVNNKPLPVLATNDVLFANKSPAGTSRYIIHFNGKKEEQRSSGIWVSTPCGSTAAIHAAGGSVMKRTEKKLQFLVREPFQTKMKPTILSGFFKKGQSLTFINKTMEGCLYVDGTQDTYPLQFGDKVTFKISKIPLQVVVNF